jgi:hypothetical protein
VLARSSVYNLKAIGGTYLIVQLHNFKLKSHAFEEMDQTNPRFLCGDAMSIVKLKPGENA